MDSTEKRTKSCAMERSKIFIYEDSFLVPVSALHRISKANFHLGCQKVSTLYSVSFINVHFIETDSTIYTKSAKVILQ